MTFHELNDMLKTTDNMYNERIILGPTSRFSLILLLKYMEVLRHLKKLVAKFLKFEDTFDLHDIWGVRDLNN